MEEAATRADLRVVLSALWRRRWIVVTTALLAVVVATVLSLLADPVYEARAEVLIQPDLAQSDPETLGRVNFSQQELLTEQRIATSQPVLERAADRLGLGPDATERITAGLEPDTRVLWIAARDEDPQRAADLAQATAEEYLEFRREEARAALETGRQRLQGHLEALRDELDRLDAILGAQDEPDPLVASERATVADQMAATSARLADFEAPESRERGSGRILAAASAPSRPTEPDLLRNGLIALTLGSAGGVVGALARDSFDEAVHSDDDATEVLGRPTLARIPRFPTGSEGIALLREPDGVTAESFRDLRTNLRFVASDLSSVTVTSSLEGEGKTTVATNLAVAASLAGFDVLIVDADLRRPTVHRLLGVHNGPGLAEVLSAGASLDDALLHFVNPDLAVLTAGRLPPNPSELLGSQRLADLLDEVLGRFDLVVFDTPPALAASDAQEIASLTSATLLVVETDATGKRALSETRDRMERAGATISGSVLNLVAPELVSYGYYHRAT